MVKELIRDSDLKLTTNLYNDSSQLPLAQGVGVLPSMAGEIKLPSRQSRSNLSNDPLRRTSKRTHSDQAGEVNSAGSAHTKMSAEKAVEKELTCPEISKTFIPSIPSRFLRAHRNAHKNMHKRGSQAVMACQRLSSRVSHHLLCNLRSVSGLARPDATKREDSRWVKWSGRGDSNSRPLAPHASALPG